MSSIIKVSTSDNVYAFRNNAESESCGCLGQGVLGFTAEKPHDGQQRLHMLSVTSRKHASTPRQMARPICSNRDAHAGSTELLQADTHSLHDLKDLRQLRGLKPVRAQPP